MKIIVTPDKVHDFHERNDWSLSQRDETFWEAIYRKAFPSLEKIELNEDISRQKIGIDRIIYLPHGKELLIDEKKRSQVYPDIVLEYCSVDKQKTPGWIEKDLAIDYLAYAFIPSQQCYLFPWHMLRLAWDKYRKEWHSMAVENKFGYHIVKAKNADYFTWSVAVPIDDLLQAVSNASLIQF